MSPSPPSPGDTRRPRSSQTVSVNIADTQPASGRRFQLEVSECVETKTVTTTTRLTRKFPHVFVRDPTPLQDLDSKEYPLAMKPTPPELAEFSYHMLEENREDQGQSCHHLVPLSSDPSPANKSIQSDCGIVSPAAVKLEPASQESTSPGPAAHQPPHSPPEPSPRRTRKTRSSPAPSPATILAASQSLSTSQQRPFSRPSRSSNLHAVSDKLRRSILNGTNTAFGEGKNHFLPSSQSRRLPADRTAQDPSAGFATPDTSQSTVLAAERWLRRRSLHIDGFGNSSPEPRPSHRPQPTPCDAESPPSSSPSHTVFSSNVATPPITDADAEPFADTDDTLSNSAHAPHPRPAVDVAAQDASLPSPRLSPTLAASQPHVTDNEDEAQANFQTLAPDDGSSWLAESQAVDETDSPLMASRHGPSDSLLSSSMRPADPAVTPPAVVIDTQSLLEAFDSMKTEMKTFMMYQFLRRCPRSTLRVIADAVNPALKCDFLRQLPLELGYHVLSYLDHQALCRAAQVSKHWRNIVDRNETGWKELLDRDGFILPPGELKKAIVQGWGWQDPVGAMGYERDLSMQGRLTSSEVELTRSLRPEVAAPKPRSSKRKRGLNAYSAAERSKRRAASQGSSVLPEDYMMTQTETKQHKSEGPLSAANAAAAAVPDPQLGLPTLRQLHLFKSLYRRHFMIRRSWTSGEVRPGHVAFAAHPRHVITCLQFDDDKIITGSDDTLIHIYDTKTGKLRRKLEGHEGGVWALQYEGNILVSGSTDRSVRVWDIERGLCQQVFYGHTSTVRCLQILMPGEVGRDSSGGVLMAPEKPLIITGSRDSQLRVWRLPEVGSRRYIQTHPPAQESDCPYFIRVLGGHTHSVRAISAYGDTLVSGSYDSTVRVWRISTGEALHVLRGHSQKVYSVVLDHVRNRCISGSMDSLVKIWDLTTGACLHNLEGHSLLVGLLDLRDERLVSAAADSTLRVWDPETGRCRNTLIAHTGAITCFQHDGRKVISGSEKSVKMWDVGTGECVQDLLTDLSGMWQVKFDGRRCVAAVQREQLTYVEILDFGAVRDGQPPEELGKRILLNEHEVREIMEDGPV